MVWVVFTEKFKFTPDRDRRATIVYQPSDEPRQVTRECAQRAVAKGAARRSQKPRKPASPDLVTDEGTTAEAGTEPDREDEA